MNNFCQPTARILAPASLAAILLLSCGPTAREPQAAAAPGTPAGAKPVADKPQQRREDALAWSGGAPTSEALGQKQAMAELHLKYFADSFPQSSGGFAVPAIPGTGLPWRNIGPNKGIGYGYNASDIDSGRLAPQGLAVTPDGATLYLASADGGVWKTTTANQFTSPWSWTPVTDALPTGSWSGNIPIGAVALAANGTLFAGMGDFAASSAVGFFRSGNGGASWTGTSQAAQQQLGRANYISYIFPVDDNNILVGCPHGIFRSTDGGATFGATWTGNRVLGTGNYADFVWSIDQVGPSTQNLVASMEEQSSQKGRAYYSSDGGGTWAQAAITGVNLANIGRMTLRSNAAVGNTTVYGIAWDSSNGRYFFPGLFKSTDSGHSYTYVADTSGIWNGNQADYNQCLAVKPNEANTNTVFAGANLGFYRTTDGGNSFTRMTYWWADSSHAYSHADNHTALWSPDGTILYVGNDGGLAVFRDPFRATPPTGQDLTFVDNRHNEDIASHLVYHLGCSNAPTVPASGRTPAQVVSVGLQDNSARIRIGTPLATSKEYDDTSRCGDGFGTLVHPLDPDRVLTSGYYAAVVWASDGGLTTSSWHQPVFKKSDGTGDTLDSGNSPFHTRLQPGWADATGNTVYLASNSTLYKSVDFGTNFQACAMAGFAGNIRNFNSAKTDGNTLGIVTQTHLFLSHDGGATWNDPVPTWPVNGTPNNLGYVWFDSNDKNVIYVTDVSAGYGFTYMHLWRSGDGGATFVDIEGTGFPSGFSGSNTFGCPVHIVQNDPTNSATLLAGTDFGVYISTNTGATWSRYGSGLPMVGARDLYIAPDASFVRVATYGRGVWEIGSPTLILLDNFRTDLADGLVKLTWITGSELDTAGFNLWRSDGLNGDFSKLNALLIPATGDLLGGATYTFADPGSTALGPFFYRLEELDTRGLSTFYGPIKADFRPGQSILQQTSSNAF